MEQLNLKQQDYKLSFHGKGADFFGVIIINWLLTVITLGFYYPWAKAKQLKFIYGSIALKEDAFTFHGTGKEMFDGFVKSILIFALILIVFLLFTLYEMPLIGMLFLYLGLFAFMPLAIHGSYRYRMSRTSWRGIRFGYRGERAELFQNWFTWIFYSIITLGFYGAWFTVNLRNYVLSNVKFGDIEFKSEANGLDYFKMNLKGYFLTLITLGVYMFWWQKDLFAFYVNNVSLHKGDKSIQLTATASAGGFFKLMVVNMLIVIFTLGLGYAWAVTRTLNYIISNIKLEGDIDLDKIIQTEDNFTDATGEDMSHLLNIDFVL